MPNTKKITVDQLQTFADGMTEANDNRFLKKTQSNASTSAAGLMSAADKTKLDGVNIATDPEFDVMLMSVGLLDSVGA